MSIYLILFPNPSPPSGRLLHLLHRRWRHAQGTHFFLGRPAEKKLPVWGRLRGVKQAPK